MIASCPAYSERTRLAKGAKAPFAGTLLDDAALASLVSKLTAIEKRAALDLERKKRECTAEKAAADSVCSAEKAALTAKLGICKASVAEHDRIYETALKSCNKQPPWYKSSYFSYFLGNLTAGTVCGLAAGLK